jgi:hypothetical protein
MSLRSPRTIVCLVGLSWVATSFALTLSGTAHAKCHAVLRASDDLPFAKVVYVREVLDEVGIERLTFELMSEPNAKSELQVDLTSLTRDEAKRVTRILQKKVLCTNVVGLLRTQDPVPPPEKRPDWHIPASAVELRTDIDRPTPMLYALGDLSSDSGQALTAFLFRDVEAVSLLERNGVKNHFKLFYGPHGDADRKRYLAELQLDELPALVLFDEGKAKTVGVLSGAELFEGGKLQQDRIRELLRKLNGEAPP